MSDSWISWNPRIDEPSKPNPSSNASSVSSPIGTEKCCISPGRSQNRRSTICAPAASASLITSAGVVVPPIAVALPSQGGEGSVAPGGGRAPSPALTLRYDRLLVGIRGPISDPPDRLDQPVVLGLELRPEPPDVDVDGARATVEVVPPDLL